MQETRTGTHQQVGGLQCHIASFVSAQVRILIIICSPIAWPISKFLDWILGSEHSALFRRAELKVWPVTGAEQGLLCPAYADVASVCGSLAHRAEKLQ